MAKKRADIQELLVWAYKDQAIDEVPNRIGGPVVSKMRWDVAIDGSDVGCDPHADAYTIAAAVRGLSRFQAAMVIGCAKVATTPDWYPGARIVFAAIVNGRGNPAGLYDDTRNLIGHRVRSAVETEGGTILYGWGESELDEARGLYLAWYEAMTALAHKLADTLDDFTVTGPAAQREPWVQTMVKAA